MQFLPYILATSLITLTLTVYLRSEHRRHRTLVRQINERFKGYLDSQDSQKAKQLYIADALLSEIKGKMLLGIIDGMPPIGGYTLELTEQEVGMLWSYFDTYHPQPINGEMMSWRPASIKFPMGVHHQNS